MWPPIFLILPSSLLKNVTQHVRSTPIPYLSQLCKQNNRAIFIARFKYSISLLPQLFFILYTHKTNLYKSTGRIIPLLSKNQPLLSMWTKYVFIREHNGQLFFGYCFSNYPFTLNRLTARI